MINCSNVQLPDADKLMRTAIEKGRVDKYVALVQQVLMVIEATYALVTRRAVDCNGAERMKFLRLAIFTYFSIARQWKLSENLLLFKEFMPLQPRALDMIKHIQSGIALSALDRYHSNYVLEVARQYERQDKKKRLLRGTAGFWSGVC